MLNNSIANEIRNNLQREYNCTFIQFKNCNAYIGQQTTAIVGNRYYSVIPIKSYNTIVAFVLTSENKKNDLSFVHDYSNLGLYEVGKYSRTTSKQVTQIHNAHYSHINRYYVDRQ